MQGWHTSGHSSWGHGGFPLLFKYLSPHSVRHSVGQKTRWSPAGPWICQCTHTHTHTHTYTPAQTRQGKKQTDGQIRMSETYTCSVSNHDHRRDNDRKSLLPGRAARRFSISSVQAACGPVQGESGGPHPDRPTPLTAWFLSRLARPSREL